MGLYRHDMVHRVGPVSRSVRIEPGKILVQISQEGFVSRRHSYNLLQTIRISYTKDAAHRTDVVSKFDQRNIERYTHLNASQLTISTSFS
jgi:hypothetical protein